VFVRWSQQSIETEQTARLPGYRDEAVMRHFDAPEAVSTNFYEVRAKSILNRVPEASRMPFRWTINPYRGCTHACAYCLRGDTRVLLANGREAAIRDVEAGDRIVGTEVVGTYRRLVETEVLDTWSSIKPAYRVTLEDGTELVASGDHRFLTSRGWKHVIGTDQGSGRRPHLTVGAKMIGLGGSAATLRATAREDPGQLTQSALEVEAILALGHDEPMYDITTGTGDFIANGIVSHNCFARPTHTYLDFNAGRDFEREIVVKVNAPERLRVELARPSWKREHIALGTNTDPYQWVEGRYKLMRGIWEAMIEARNPGSVLTKSPLLLRDLDLMKELASRADFSAALSVPTLDEKAWRATEPHTPNPKARLEAVAELTRAGIRTGILIAPLMPGINDSPEQVARILEMASEAGAEYVSGIALHLRGEVREVFMDWLAENRSDLVDRYRELYRRGAYAPTAERRRLARLVQGPDVGPWERSGRTGSPPQPAPEPAPAAEQQMLFSVG
jgi:DNA repair photolyase